MYAMMIILNSNILMNTCKMLMLNTRAPDGTWFDPPNYPFSVAMHNAVSHVLTDMIPVNYEKFDFIQLSLPSCWRDFKTKYPIGNKLDNNGNPVLLNGEPIKCYRYQYEVFSL